MTTSVRAASIESRSASAAAAPGHRVWRRRFALLHVFATFVLLVAGASVTSNDAGLSVRDWPSSLGYFNPIAVHLRGLVTGLVAIEHGHREIGMVVGLLTIALSAWLWATAEGRALRVLGVTLLATVIAQGSLGGLTVKLELPAAVSVAHGMLAQGFFCLSIATAWLLSAEGSASAVARGASKQGRTAGVGPHLDAAPPIAAAAQALRRAAKSAFGAVALQLLLGAIVRHTVAKWRVPTFLDPAVIAHALFAAAVVGAIGALVARVVYAHAGEPRLLRPALALGVLVVLQAVLGLLSVLTRTDPLVTVLHVITGAAILGLCLLVVLRSSALAERRTP